MMVDDEAFRRESQPLKPEYWVGAEVRPARVTFYETAEASSAYRRVAEDHPKAISTTNRIHILSGLQEAATVLALQMAREFRVGDARLLLKGALQEAEVLGPLPIALATIDSVEIVDRALRFDMDDIAVPWVLIDLLRLIEGVRP